jgi:hypothetical protein
MLFDYVWAVRRAFFLFPISEFRECLWLFTMCSFAKFHLYEKCNHTSAFRTRFSEVTDACDVLRPLMFTCLFIFSVQYGVYASADLYIPSTEIPLISWISVGDTSADNSLQSWTLVTTFEAKPALCATQTLRSGPATHPSNFIPGGILKHKLRWGLEDPWHQTHIYVCVCSFPVVPFPLQDIILKRWGVNGRLMNTVSILPPHSGDVKFWERRQTKNSSRCFYSDCHNALHFISPSPTLSYPHN